jgi:uncharacterized membrane protein
MTDPTAETGPDAAPTVYFDAVLRPHRSLPPSGFFAVMALVGGMSFCAGIVFVLAGAWPVTGFFGLDVLLVYVAFRLNYRSARLHETIHLTRDSLVVERIGVRGDRMRWQFQPYWLRVVFQEHDEDSNSLVLTSHGRSLLLGSFLAPGERRALAAALQDALARSRRVLPEE